MGRWIGKGIVPGAAEQVAALLIKLEQTEAERDANWKAYEEMRHSWFIANERRIAWKDVAEAWERRATLAYEALRKIECTSEFACATGPMRIAREAMRQFIDTRIDANAVSRSDSESPNDSQDQGH